MNKASAKVKSILKIGANDRLDDADYSHKSKVSAASFKSGTSSIEEELYNLGLAHEEASKLCMSDEVNKFTQKLLKLVDKSQQELLNVCERTVAFIVKTNDRNDVDADKYFLPYKLAIDTGDPKIREMALTSLYQLVVANFLKGDSVVDPIIYHPRHLNGPKSYTYPRRVISVLLTLLFDTSSCQNQSVQHNTLRLLWALACGGNHQPHGTSLMRIVRICYNIHLLSAFPENRESAQHLLCKIMRCLASDLEAAVTYAGDIVLRQHADGSARRQLNLDDSGSDGEGGGGGGAQDEAFHAWYNSPAFAEYSKRVKPAPNQISVAQFTRADGASNLDNDLTVSSWGTSALSPVLARPKQRVDHDDEAEEFQLFASLLADDVFTVLSSITVLLTKQIVYSTDEQSSERSSAANVAAASADELAAAAAASKLKESMGVRSKAVCLLLITEFLVSVGPVFKTMHRFLHFTRHELIDSLLYCLGSQSPTLALAAGKALSTLILTLREQVQPELGKLVTALMDIVNHGSGTGAVLYEHKLSALKVLLRICAAPETVHDLFRLESIATSGAATAGAASTAYVSAASLIAQAHMTAEMDQHAEIFSDTTKRSIVQHLAKIRPANPRDDDEGRVSSSSSANSSAKSAAKGEHAIFKALTVLFQSYAEGSFSSGAYEQTQVASLRLVANRALVSVMHTLLLHREIEAPATSRARAPAASASNSKAAPVPADIATFFLASFHKP